MLTYLYIKGAAILWGTFWLFASAYLLQQTLSDYTPFAKLKFWDYLCGAIAFCILVKLAQTVLSL